jgi:hypothetical protein
LNNGTLTRARYWAKQGADWKREGTQAIKEMIELEMQWNDARKAAGLDPAPYPWKQAGAVAQAPKPTEEPGDEEPIKDRKTA